MNIKEILESKPHNKHYLNRYVKYIVACEKINKSTDKDTYMENHHICPKANDLFPEYVDLDTHKWNSVNLTMEQHIYSHILLWKLYGGSQTYALDWIFSKNKNKDENLLSRKIPSKLQIRYAAKLRLDARLLLNAKLSEFWTGRMRYMTPDGVYHGSYLKQDPIITKLNLVPLQTDAQRQQLADRLALATAAHLGTNLWTNGIDEQFSVECPGSGWKLGRAPRSDEWSQKQKAASMAKCVGMETWNNGVNNFFVAPGSEIQPDWVRGMKPQKKREYWYSNGVDSVKIVFGYPIPDGFTKIAKKNIK